MKFFWFSILFSSLLLGACGRHVDSNEDLKAGYHFKKDSVFYKVIYRGEHNDSVKYTLKDFTILDTLPEYERYIIGDSQGRHKFYVPKLGHGDAGGGTIETSHTFNYGAANFDGEIVIFPRFWQWLDLGSGYFGVRKYRNTPEMGVLHIQGVMITDIKYESLVSDSVSKQIICGFMSNDKMLYDTIDSKSGSVKRITQR